ncbi:hypothetical protein ACJX0J_033970, partial [Zea mays]
MDKAVAILQHIETAQKDVWYIIARLEDAQKLGVWSEGRVVEAQDFFDMVIHIGVKPDLFTEKCSGRIHIEEGLRMALEDYLKKEIEEVPERSKRLLTRLISEDQFENMKSSWRSHKNYGKISLLSQNCANATCLILKWKVSRSASLDWLGNLLISCLVNRGINLIRYVHRTNKKYLYRCTTQTASLTVIVQMHRNLEEEKRKDMHATFIKYLVAKASKIRDVIDDMIQNLKDISDLSNKKSDKQDCQDPGPFSAAGHGIAQSLLQVSKMVPGRSAEDCFNRIYTDLSTPTPIAPRPRASKTTFYPIGNLTLSDPKPPNILEPTVGMRKSAKQKSLVAQKTVRH